MPCLTYVQVSLLAVLHLGIRVAQNSTCNKFDGPNLFGIFLKCSGITYFCLHFYREGFIFLCNQFLLPDVPESFVENRKVTRRLSKKLNS